MPHAATYMPASQTATPLSALCSLLPPRETTKGLTSSQEEDVVLARDARYFGSLPPSIFHRLPPPASSVHDATHDSKRRRKGPARLGPRRPADPPPLPQLCVPSSSSLDERPRDRSRLWVCGAGVSGALRVCFVLLVCLFGFAVVCFGLLKAGRRADSTAEQHPAAWLFCTNFI